MTQFGVNDKKQEPFGSRGSRGSRGRRPSHRAAPAPAPTPLSRTGRLARAGIAPWAFAFDRALGLRFDRAWAFALSTARARRARRTGRRAAASGTRPSRPARIGAANPSSRQIRAAAKSEQHVAARPRARASAREDGLSPSVASPRRPSVSSPPPSVRRPPAPHRSRPRDRDPAASRPRPGQGRGRRLGLNRPRRGPDASGPRWRPASQAATARPPSTSRRRCRRHSD